MPAIFRPNPPIRPVGNRIDGIHPDAPSLAGYGPHPVGVCTYTLINPSQPDLTNDRTPSLKDRSLIAEFWYPAAQGSPQGGSYSTLLRDGTTPVTLHGRAHRKAKGADGRFPLVVISHGYPGNRYLMAHLAETLASRGYGVIAADHSGSTYDDKGPFAATLLHRPLDQRFLIDSLAAASLPIMLDTSNCAVIGYSMGAYGALTFAGAGLSDKALAYAAPHSTALQRHAEAEPRHIALIDPRVKAVVPIGLWGGQHGFWSKTALASVQKPILLIAGSDDQISGYETGIRPTFADLTSTTRHLLTFDMAGHNAAAPIPAPENSWTPSAALDFLPAEHYADEKWETLWMNAVAQHVIATFLGLYLREQTDLSRYLAPDLAGISMRDGLRFETLTKTT